jgi:hypothetical protein
MGFIIAQKTKPPICSEWRFYNQKYYLFPLFFDFFADFLAFLATFLAFFFAMILYLD